MDYDQSKEISKPIKNTVRARLETTVMICFCQGLFFFLIAISRIFNEMNSKQLFDPIRLGSNHEITLLSLILTSALGAIGCVQNILFLVKDKKEMKNNSACCLKSLQQEIFLSE